MRQKQRIALVSDLIRKHQVLIVGKFTSGLDQLTEEQILTDLLSVMQEKTIICITHSAVVAPRMEQTILLYEVSSQ